jgi:hypothetical protein
MDPGLDPSQEAVRERVREKSRLLFGNRDRLEVAAAVARSDDDAVNATDLSFELALANNRVRSQLLTLTELGFLVLGPPGPGKRWYIRQPNDFWAFCALLYETWSR